MTHVAVLSAHEGSASWRGLLESMVAGGGITVTPLSGYSDDEYRTSRSPVERIRLRLKTYLVYPIRVVGWRRRLSREFDAIIVITSPFYLPAIVTALVRSPRIIVLQNDIYPEALIVKKLIRRGGLMDRLIGRVIHGGLRRASEIVYIAEDHRRLVARTGGPADGVVIAVPSSLTPLSTPPRPKAPTDPVTALYAGTLGTMHDTSTLLDFLAARPLPPLLRLVFRTSGSGKAAFEKKVTSHLSDLLREEKLTLADSVPDAEWVSMMYAADIGLVFQDAGAGDVVFPSKVASILVSGQALLAIAEPESAVGKLVADTDCGWVVAPHDIDALARAFAEATQPETLARKRSNASAIGRDRFSLDAVANQWRRAVMGGPR